MTHVGSDDAVLARIAELVRAEAGITPPAWVLAARVKERAAALGDASLDDYRKRLPEPAELAALVEALRVGETRFFRHPGQLELLARDLLPELRRRPSRRVRAWSAGCASGEEPYTLAILLAAAFPLAQGWRVDVLASDVSESGLAQARRGVFPRRVLADVPPEHAGAFVVEEDGVRVAPAIAKLVRFEKHDLMAGRYPQGLDVVLCRNVLIYFDEIASRRIHGELCGSLAPGGYLLLGHAEAVRDYSMRAELEPRGVATYQRVVEAAPKPSRTAAKAPAHVERAFTSNVIPANAGIHAGQAGPVLDPRSREGDDFGRSTPLSEGVVSIRGRHQDAAEVTRELRAALSGAHGKLVVDLEASEYLADDIAPVIRRARAAAEQAGVTVEIRAHRPGPRRWLARHGLLGEEDGR